MCAMCMCSECGARASGSDLRSAIANAEPTYLLIAKVMLRSIQYSYFFSKSAKPVC